MKISYSRNLKAAIRKTSLKTLYQLKPSNALKTQDFCEKWFFMDMIFYGKAV